MQFVAKYATPNHLHFSDTTYAKENFIDNNGKLKKGHVIKWKITHFALSALFKFSEENPAIRPYLIQKLNLQKRPGELVTIDSLWKYEIQLNVAMMHWDEVNKSFKAKKLISVLKNRGTTLEKIFKIKNVMDQEQKRLFKINNSYHDIQRTIQNNHKYIDTYSGIKEKDMFKTLLDSCPLFQKNREHLAVARIGRWWLRKNRKYPIYYTSILPLIEKLFGDLNIEYLYGNSEKRNQNLLKIQENIIFQRRKICNKISQNLVNTIIKNCLERHAVS